MLQIDTLVTEVAEQMAAEEPVVEAAQEINLWTMASYGGWIMIVLAILLLSEW